ncbi:hypothetical protein GCM10027348_39890 [Hymenobacter tenuis]
MLGLRTVIYAAPDLAAATAWYTDWLGLPPYFQEPFYVGFNVGGYELGLDPHAQPTPGSTLPYRGVADIDAAWTRALVLGARAEAAIADVGGGIKAATVLDPWGNQLGLLENPHFCL